MPLKPIRMEQTVLLTGSWFCRSCSEKSKGHEQPGSSGASSKRVGWKKPERLNTPRTILDLKCAPIRRIPGNRSTSRCLSEKKIA